MHSKIPLPPFASIAFTTLGLLVSSSLRGNAAEFHVPAEFPTIQAALNAAAAGDEILVAPGFYQEFLNFNQKDVILTGTDGAEATILQAPTAGPGVIIGPAGSISGFTIRKPSPLMAGTGIAAQGSGSYIASNIFHTNRDGLSFFGAAISMNNASPVIERNVFRNNFPTPQSLSGVISLINNSSPYIANNIFYGNGGGRAINVTVPATASPVVINNTIIGSGAGIRVDTRISTASQIYRNNLIQGNNVGFQTEFGVEANMPVWENNLVWGNNTDYSGISNQTGTNGNISGDPLFEDAAARDYRLQSGSPAIDAGNNLLAPPMDFEAKPRPIDGNGDAVAIVDIGAYEFPGIIGSMGLIVEGGDLQECLSPQGNSAEVKIITFPEGLKLTSVELFLNGTSVAKTLPSQVTLPMGTNQLEAVAFTAAGYQVRSQRTVEVVDTTAPVIDARFVDRRTGRELSSVNANGMTFVTVKIAVDDTCDPAPEVESMLGTEVRDGDALNIIGQVNQLRLNTDRITLKVLAKDASGNVSVQTRKLAIRGKNAK